jgi:hypothetical protein
LSKNIQQTMMTPGWAEIVELAERRIERNGLAMMLAKDETEALTAHRAYWGAANALQEFLQSLKDEDEESK